MKTEQELRAERDAIDKQLAAMQPDLRGKCFEYLDGFFKVMEDGETFGFFKREKLPLIMTIAPIDAVMMETLTTPITLNEYNAAMRDALAEIAGTLIDDAVKVKS